MKYTIYKIICKDQNVKELYIGSTKDFKHRKMNHKSDCNNVNGTKYNYLIYRTIRANGGFDNWNIEIVEELVDISKKDALTKEEYYRNLLNATLNSQSANTGIDYSGMLKNEYNKEYKAQNREHIKEKIICPCGASVRRDSIRRHKKTEKHRLKEIEFKSI